MNINPFDMLKNAKMLQEQMGKMQEEMERIVATGSSGGGIVKISINGKFEMLSVSIDPIAVDPRDVPMLQDLIRAAYSDAFSKIKDELQSRIGPLAGGFPSL